MTEITEVEKNRASKWFLNLRNEIVSAFEELEQSHFKGPFSELNPGKFEVNETKREEKSGVDAGGGLMSVMRNGRIFEKVGVNVSTVYGNLNEAAQHSMAERLGIPEMRDDPKFWASGISLVAHVRNPNCPAVHMNTRMFWTPYAWWFGGGSDLNPCIEFEEDTIHFHSVLRSYLDQHNPKLYPELKKWADEYFFIPHRKRARGVGGIFMDDRNTGDWEADFNLTKDIGKAFLPAYLPLLQKRLVNEFNESDIDIQLQHRGLYAEYNLVYDRGTKFGLATGHDANAVLMSLPPVAKWY